MSKKTKLSFTNIPKDLEMRAYILNDILTGFPKVTVVIGKYKDTYCRGLAICSDSEIEEKGFVSHTGIEIAMKQMFKAFNSKESTEPIITDRSRNILNDLHLKHTVYEFKSHYNSFPIRTEEILFDNKDTNDLRKWIRIYNQKNDKRTHLKGKNCTINIGNINKNNFPMGIARTKIEKGDIVNNMDIIPFYEGTFTFDANFNI